MNQLQTYRTYPTLPDRRPVFSHIDHQFTSMRKRLLFCVSFLFCTAIAWGQDGRWEAGWQVYNSRPLPPGVDFSRTDKVSPGVLNGMLIKHSSESFKQRFSLQYISKSENEDFSQCCDFFVSSPTTYKGVELAVGIEKSALLGPFEYYFLFDLNMGIGQYKGMNDVGFPLGAEVFNLRYRSLGATPGGGLSLWMGRRVAVNWELRWLGAFYKTRGSYLSAFSGPTERRPNEGFAWQNAPESHLSLLLSIW